jgi:hypothetical protein
MMSQEIPYGSTLEYGTWATFDEATRTYKVRVIDRRQRYPQFVDADMPERSLAGVRRINVINCNSTYTTADGIIPNGPARQIGAWRTVPARCTGTC